MISTQTWQLVEASKVQTAKFEPTMHKVQEELCSYISSNLRRNDVELLSYACSLTGLGINANAWKLGGFRVYYGVESTLLSPQRTKGLDVRPHSTQFLRASPSLKKSYIYCFWVLNLFLYIILCQSESKESTRT